MPHDVRRVYDRLSRFESRWIRLFTRKISYPIHRSLNFGRSERTRTYRDLNDWILHNVRIGDRARVLDAGCGVGETLFALCRTHDITGLGISISEVEIERAKRAARGYSLTDRCDFFVRSYDDAFPEPFDLIIAIESIKHSDDLTRTLTNLATGLKHRGQLIIVDDFRTGGIEEDPFRKTFMDFWSLQHMYEERSCVEILKRAGGEVREIVDLTPFVEKKDRSRLTTSIKLLTALKRVALLPSLRNLCSLYIGGLILDYYYAVGTMEYKLIRFERARR
jgi:SAM-dependent methyltransferase